MYNLFSLDQNKTLPKLVLKKNTFVKKNPPKMYASPIWSLIFDIMWIGAYWGHWHVEFTCLRVNGSIQSITYLKMTHIQLISMVFPQGCKPTGTTPTNQQEVTTDASTSWWGMHSTIPQSPNIFLHSDKVPIIGWGQFGDSIFFSQSTVHTVHVVQIPALLWTQIPAEQPDDGNSHWSQTSLLKSDWSLNLEHVLWDLRGEVPLS